MSNEEATEVHEVEFTVRTRAGSRRASRFFLSESSAEFFAAECEVMGSRPELTTHPLH
jgi:hypothetical protein